ncbi:MAG: alpha/beta hydrolase [Rhodospirillales bacterium]|nr:alpha/beta hydrolase [Rhodospirillales bacterium]
MAEALAGPSHLPESGIVDQLVIFLHGYGADGNDLIGLAPIFAKFLPNTAFYAPDAPEPCEMSPYGRQWFSLNTYDPEQLRRDPKTMGAMYEAMLTGAQLAAPSINQYIDERLAEHGLGPDKLALIGFSQGTMMSLQVALRRSEPIAALLGYSGALVGADLLEKEIISRPPITLIHGVADPVVPFEALEAATKALLGAGLSVESHPRPDLEHGIDPEGVKIGVEFLRQKFGIN